jgi:hypothetical protein
MFDEQVRLSDDGNLLWLLEHYAAVEERETWLDRVMNLNGIEPAELTRLHGELIAYGWVEQNTGVLARVEAGACLASYRSTPAGRRALTRHQRSEEHEDLAA